MDGEKIACRICSRTFTTRNNMRRHLSLIHKIGKPQSLLQVNKKNFTCCEDNCTFGSSRLQQLISHLQETHQMKFELGTEKFDSQEHFERWKINFEKDTHSRFVQRKGHVARKGISQIIYYRCNRTGFYRPKVGPTDVARKRKPRARGSNKQDAPCTAYIDLTRNQHGLSAVFCKTHYRHAPTEGRYLPLEESLKMRFVQKISEGLPLEMVREDLLKDAPASEIPKIQRMSKKERNNILLAFNLTQIEDPDDGTKLESWAADMTELGADSPIQVFKPKGVESPELKMGEDDFCLVVITSKQCELISNLDRDSVVCVDSTPGLNECHLEMVSLLVLDHGEAFPVAFMISNRRDIEPVLLFFETVRDVAGPVIARGLMGPDDDIYYEAWSRVMQHSPKNFLSLWHVEIEMRKKLQLINNQELQNLIWMQITEYAYESRDTNGDISNFVENVVSNPRSKEFGEFFKETYADRKELWTFQNRTTFHPEMSSKFESLHDTLRVLYLKSKKVKRLDKCLMSSIRIFKDKLVRRERNINRERLVHRLSALSEIHAQGISTKADVQKVSETSWELNSSDSSECFLVESMQCSVCCEFRCEACQICLHMYTCSCECYLLQNTICKHIHFVNHWLKLKKPVNCNKDVEMELQPSPTTYLKRNESETQVSVTIRKQLEKDKGQLRSALSKCVTSVRNISTKECFQDVQKHVQALLAILGESDIRARQKKYVNNYSRNFKKRKAIACANGLKVSSLRLTDQSRPLTKIKQATVTKKIPRSALNTQPGTA